MTAPNGWSPGPGDWIVDPHARTGRSPALAVAGAVLLALLLAAAGVLTHRALAPDPDPDPPLQAVEEHPAVQRPDWLLSWRQLCAAAQRQPEAADRPVRIEDAVEALVEQYDAGYTVSVGEVRRTSSQTWAVDVEIGRDGDTHHVDLLVVDDGGGSRGC
ncbi:hypothetical protein ACI780_18160 [Geodermatophilus sp. SYSU D00814]